MEKLIPSSVESSPHRNLILGIQKAALDAVEDGFGATRLSREKAKRHHAWNKLEKAFEAEELSEFDRGPKPNVLYAGMMQYDGDLCVPDKYLVSPPAIDRTMSEYLSNAGVKQFAISETQKFGHVTYFWNGNNSEPFDAALEDWIEVPSDNVSFDQKPEMKAREVCDEVVKDLETKAHRFIRVNFANGDMVGHTGSL